MTKSLRRAFAWMLILLLIGTFIPLPTSGAGATQRSIQDGVTLHCWNWSFKNIEANMSKIAALGYTAIQTSPIQQAKQATAGYPGNDWWVYYQPASFQIDNSGKSALGNKAEFKSMCATAHDYGIKVIVDVVANHMGDNGSNRKSSAIIDDIEKDASCWHDISRNIGNYYDRYHITQFCLDGLPDLNTGSDKIQNYVLNFLKECIDAGADGFRFDAVKHIETPDDPWCASDFWPTVVNGAKNYARSSRGISLYCYGELLYHPDEGSSLPDSAYTKYMSVTDNSYSNYIRNEVIGNGNAGAYSHNYHKNASASQLVLWAESHDNYAGDGSRNISTQNINKAWALVAARGDAMSLYLARPENTYPQKLGVASVTGWSYKEVGAVNKFHNDFIGQSEYVSNQNGIAYVERGNSGVVLVNCGGSSASVNVTANVMKNGTYIDQITGNTFTVSGGRIKGTIGSTGIAVVYNPAACSHPSHNAAGSCTSCYAQVGHSYNSSGKCACGAVKVADRVIYFTNSANWSRVNIYSWYSPGNEITASWPGDAMTRVEGNLYSYVLPGDAVNVIFTNGSSQTYDLTIPSGKNLYDYATGKWSTYTEKSDPQPETQPSTQPVTRPTVQPETKPSVQPETQPVIKPAVPTPDETAPTVGSPGGTLPGTEPVTTPVTEPTSETDAPPTTQPEETTDPETEPDETTEPNTNPNTVTKPSEAPTTDSTTPTLAADPTEPGNGIGWVIWLAGGILLLAAATGGTIMVIKRKKGT